MSVRGKSLIATQYGCRFVLLGGGIRKAGGLAEDGVAMLSEDDDEVEEDELDEDCG